MKIPAIPAASDEQSVQEAPYPVLQEKAIEERARPRLGYELQQEREIRNELAADLQYARYEGRRLTQEISGEPLPPSQPVVRPPQVTSTVVPATRPPPTVKDPATESVREAIRDAEDDGSLQDFLDTLERQAPDPAEVAPPSFVSNPVRDEQAHNIANTTIAPEPKPEQQKSTFEDLVPAEAVPDAAGPQPKQKPGDSAEAGRFSEFRGGIKPAAAEPGRATDELNQYVISFEPGGLDLPEASKSLLREIGEKLKSSKQGVLIVAGGKNSAVALDRGREIAVRLVARGVNPQLIEIEANGTDDRALLYPSTDGT